MQTRSLTLIIVALLSFTPAVFAWSSSPSIAHHTPSSVTDSASYPTTTKPPNTCATITQDTGSACPTNTCARPACEIISTVTLSCGCGSISMATSCLTECKYGCYTSWVTMALPCATSRSSSSTPASSSSASAFSSASSSASYSRSWSSISTTSPSTTCTTSSAPHSSSSTCTSCITSSKSQHSSSSSSTICTTSSTPASSVSKFSSSSTPTDKNTSQSTTTSQPIVPTTCPARHTVIVTSISILTTCPNDVTCTSLIETVIKETETREAQTVQSPTKGSAETTSAGLPPPPQFTANRAVSGRMLSLGFMQDAALAGLIVVWGML